MLSEISTPYKRYPWNQIRQRVEYLMMNQQQKGPLQKGSSIAPTKVLLSVSLIILAMQLLFVTACSFVNRELAVPDVRQATDYTCSASALQAVLAYYGIEAREDVLARELGADPNAGVNPPAIIRVARARGLTAELQQGMTVDEIAGIIRTGSPVLVALQAWSDKPRSTYRDDWDDGHYAIIIAVEQDTIVFEDPSVLGSRSVLSRREFEDRWHDTDGTHMYVRMGIIFGGKPVARSHRIPME